jgi:putative two-component system response regulator
VIPEHDESILCVDDDPQVRDVIVRMLSASGYSCVGAGSAEEARHILGAHTFALVLCDIDLPGRSGLGLAAELRRAHPEVVTVMVTGHDDPELAETALELGAYGYLTKPFGANQLVIQVTNALHRRELEAAHRTHEASLEETVAVRTADLELAVGQLEESELELRRAYSETVARLSRAIESRDGLTGAHVERVGSATERIALALGVISDRAELLGLASQLHDIGKIAISDAVLRKPGLLDLAERAEMERHAVVGRDLLVGSDSSLLATAADIAWTHHERWDARGYPRGLGGAEIPLEGRIVAVADVYDALTNERPYRPAWFPAEAREYIHAGAGNAFDPEVVGAFLNGD